ncbi:MAG: hypothetical protein VX965_00915 [Candidatus Thermoplasmatota archaeon]|nr:hypothetical protein [Candidatus Thermoplasmatota archaeon]
MSGVSLYERILGDATDERLRGWAINAAIVGFLLHVVACTLHRFSSFDVPDMNGFFDSYLDALYTPFSIILAYEVYELIRAIPESFSISIGKQFEVMSLLVVRDMFKNLADVEKASGTAVDTDVALIAVEALAFLILFTTALYFRRVTHASKHDEDTDEGVARFVQQKKSLACGLAGVYVMLAIYSFTSWSMSTLDGEGDLSRTVFFLDFFTFLILSDIIILLVSYKHITDFPQLARNTGFVLSTVTIRVGIGTPGFTGAALFILSALLAAGVLRLSLSETTMHEAKTNAEPAA